MDENRRELVRRMFAAATALIETAHEAAIAGQSKAQSALITSRKTVVRGRPIGFAAGRCGVIKAHSPSVRSLA